MKSTATVSVRTFRQHLTSYQLLGRPVDYDYIENNLAIHYLRSPSHSHNQIALWLGYTEASQYYQAFKR